jgi:hypothetical protein
MSIITGFVVQSDGRPIIDKDPDASLLYGLDVAGLISSGDTLSTATAPASLGVTAGTVSITGTVISVRVSAGTPGVVGSVTVRWTTTGGDTDERTLYFNVKQR